MEPSVHDATLDMHLAREQLLSLLDRLGESDWSRYVPYGSLTLRELLAHLAGADQAWAVAARALLRIDAGATSPPPPADIATMRRHAIERGRGRTIDELRQEMDRRRKLLLTLYDLLEPRHLALSLPSYGERHNAVRERIWRGYHDRLHAADVERSLRLRWQPQELRFLEAIVPAVEALAPDETLYVAYSVDPLLWEKRARGLDWTYRELLAHIATGDWVLQMQLRHLLDIGEAAAWPDVDAGNATRIGERRFSNDRMLIEEFLSMRHETMLLFSQLEPAHLAQRIEYWWEPAGNDHSVLDYILGFERHDATHREQLRPAMKYATARGGG